MPGFLSLVTIERFICVYFLFKVKFWYTTRKAKIVCSILGVVLVGVNLPQLLARYDDDGCLPYPRFASYMYFYWSNIDLVLYSFPPSLTLCITNFLIVYKLKKYASDKNQVQNSTMVKNSKKMTVKLLTVSTSFICLTMPVQYFTIFVERTLYNNYSDNIWFAIVNVSRYLNHSINFFLYIVFADTFRIELKKMLWRSSIVGPANEPNSETTNVVT